MDIRRAAVDIVLRTSSSSAVSISPSVYPLARRRISSLQSIHRPYARPQPSKTGRAISTSPTTSQQGAAAARKEEEDNAEEQNQPSGPEPTSQSSLPLQRGQSELDFLNHSNRGIIWQPTPRQSFAKEDSQNPPKKTPYNPRSPIPGISERLGFLRQPQQQRQQPQRRQRQGSSASEQTKWTFDELIHGLGQPIERKTPASNNRSDASLMLQPSQYASPNDALNLTKRVEPDLSPPSFRLGPSLGRTVEVNAKKNMDLARAFAVVNMKCTANNLKQDMFRQRFHERPGMKRKRLASLRWRKRFQDDFKATVRRVEELRRKGW